MSRQTARLMALTTLCLPACGRYAVDTLAHLPLPPGDALAHTGQAVQRLEIDHDHQRTVLTAVLAQSEDGLSIALLDPLGRRLLSVTRRAGTIDHYRAAALPDGLPVHFVLATTLLAWSPPASWKVLEGTPWSLSVSCRQRLLSYRDRPVLSATFDSPSFPVCSEHYEVSEVGMQLTLTHWHQPLSITMTTEQWHPL